MSSADLSASVVRPELLALAAQQMDEGELRELALRQGRTIAYLLQLDAAPRKAERLTIPQAGNTDASGNITFPVYQVSPGFQLLISGFTVECNTFGGTTMYTPASPYSAAGFWLALFSSPDPAAVAQGQMLDFLPTTAGAAGMPGVAFYTENGPTVRDGNFLVCYCKSGPANSRVTVRVEGNLTAL